jgi:hypothetical protein
MDDDQMDPLIPEEDAAEDDELDVDGIKKIPADDLGDEEEEDDEETM